VAFSVQQSAVGSDYFDPTIGEAIQLIAER